MASCWGWGHGRGKVRLDAPTVVGGSWCVETHPTVYELFGLHKSYCIANLEEIDYNKPLPEEVVYVLLECAAAVNEGNGSYLVLVWFQHSNQDPFLLVKEKLEIIAWEKCAQDYKT